MSSYSASSEVKFAHSFSQNYEFNSDDLNNIQNVVIKILIAPATIAALGLLSIVGFVFAMLFSCCCKCCNPFRPMDKVGTENIGDNKNVEFEKNLRIALLVSIGMFVFTDIFTLVGSSYINDGFDGYNSTISFIEALFQTLTINFGQIGTLSTDISNLSNSMSNCPDIGSSLSSINNLLSFSNNIQNALNKVITTIQQLDSYVNDYAIQWYKYPFLLVWACAMIPGIILFCGGYFRNRRALEAGIGIGVALFIIQIILGFIWMLLSTLLAIPCDPSPFVFLSQYIPNDVKVQNVTSYYEQCSGTSYLQIKIHEGLSKLGSTYGELKCPTHPQDPNIIILQRYFNSTEQYLYNTTALVDCNIITPVLQGLLYDDMCGYLFEGIYMTWVSQLVTTFFMFTSFIIAFYLLPHYSKKYKESFEVDITNVEGPEAPFTENENQDDVEMVKSL